MFNREIQVKMVKKTKNETEVDTTDSHFEGKAAIISNAVDNGLKRIGIAIVSYVLVDTVRQVLVAKASKR